MATVLITGANRGLGLEFCRQYAAAGDRVIACCRQPQQAEALQQLADHYPQLSIHTLDVTDFSQIDTLADTLKDASLDILISNAGVYGDSQRYAFGQLDYTQWRHTLEVNTLAPVKLAETFLPHLKRAVQPRLVVITSKMGSIGDNSSGGCLLYRSSKAALNAAMKSLAIDLAPENISVLIQHPGWVRTDMGGPNGLINTEQSIAGMRQRIAELNLENSGSFVDYKGEGIPW